jgi:hypothetical protein
MILWQLNLEEAGGVRVYSVSAIPPPSVAGNAGGSVDPVSITPPAATATGGAAAAVPLPPLSLSAMVGFAGAGGIRVYSLAATPAVGIGNAIAALASLTITPPQAGAVVGGGAGNATGSFSDISLVSPIAVGAGAADASAVPGVASLGAPAAFATGGADAWATIAPLSIAAGLASAIGETYVPPPPAPQGTASAPLIGITARGELVVLL